MDNQMIALLFFGFLLTPELILRFDGKAKRRRKLDAPPSHDQLSVPSTGSMVALMRAVERHGSSVSPAPAPVAETDTNALHQAETHQHL